MKTYGYARCSTNEDKQDINRQIRELKAAGADEVIFEYEHGDAKVKKNLYMLLEMAASGDTIITMEVSRLSRSTQQLCEILDIVKNKHLRLVIVGSITVDCRKGKIDPMSQAFIQMSAVFAELELSIIRARVKSGMANAKSKGKENTNSENKHCIRQHGLRGQRGHTVDADDLIIKFSLLARALLVENQLLENTIGDIQLGLAGTDRGLDDRNTFAYCGEVRAKSVLLFAKSLELIARHAKRRLPSFMRT